jgi:hypothetical protein
VAWTYADDPQGAVAASKKRICAHAAGKRATGFGIFMAFVGSVWAPLLNVRGVGIFECH